MSMNSKVSIITNSNREGCTVDDTIKLILGNLKESIKLWVRMGTDEGFKKA